MHDGPEDPCGEACELYEPQVGYCVGAAHDCEIALIPIPEWFRFRLTCHPAANDIPDVLPFLDRRLSYSWHRHWSFRFDAQQISHWSNDMRGVANSENFRIYRYRQVWSDDDLSGLVCFSFSQRPAAEATTPAPHSTVPA